MVVIPGDRVLLDPTTVVTVAEAYYSGEQVHIITAAGRNVWIAVDRLRTAPPVPSWRR